MLILQYGVVHNRELALFTNMKDDLLSPAELQDHVNRAPG